MRPLALGLAFVLLVVGATVPPGDAQKTPVKVGLLLSYTGVLGLYGPEMTKAIELYLKHSGDGGDIQLLREDDEGKPDVGLTKLRKLVERDRVNFLIGPVSSAVALAIRSYLDEKKVPTVVPIAYTRELTSPEKASRYIFRVIDTTDQNGYPFGQWAFKKKGLKRMALVGSNFVSGRDAVGAFKAGFEEAGGKVVTELFPPIGALDFAPFLSRVEPSQVDATYVVVFGSDAVRFAKQWEELGYKGQLPLLGYGTTFDDNLLEPMGKAGEGALSISPYSTTTDSPENRAFVTAMRVATHADPVLFHATAWVAIQLISRAVKDLKGEVGDTERAVEAMKRAGDGLATPMGTLRFDRYNQMIPTLHIREARLAEGKVKNVGIETLPPVPQESVWGWWRRPR